MSQHGSSGGDQSSIDIGGFVDQDSGFMAKETNGKIRKRAITEHGVLCEAYDYDEPVPFSRGMRVEMGGATFLFISGTASVNEEGESIHIGDFEAQTWRTFNNIKALLESEGASWEDVVRTTCYLRDIERDYEVFNKVRKAFYDGEGLDPYPASTGIQAILCRPELLVEIEAIAVLPPSAS
jgi:enamine deaminase RidA (YjgF/YER057c/UK114 family)